MLAVIWDKATMLCRSALLAVRRRSKDHLSDLFEDRLHLHTTQYVLRSFGKSINFLNLECSPWDSFYLCIQLDDPDLLWTGETNGIAS